MAVTLMTRSGFCVNPSLGSHTWCHEHKLLCSCACHEEPTTYAQLDAEFEERAAGYGTGQQAEFDTIPLGESGEGQGT